MLAVAVEQEMYQALAVLVVAVVVLLLALVVLQRLTLVVGVVVYLITIHRAQVAQAS